MLSFLAKTFGAAAEAPKPTASGPLFVVPPSLPQLGAKTGADLAALGDFLPLAAEQNPLQLTPSQYLAAALNERQDVIPVTQALAYSLPEKQRLQWALDSCEEVKGQLPESELLCLKSASDYLAAPTAANQEIARLAASKADFQGPAGWAAKAASLSSLTPSVPLSPAVQAALAKDPPAKTPDVVGLCVAGAVMLAATRAGQKAKKPDPGDAPEKPATIQLAKPNLAPSPDGKPARGSQGALKMATDFKPFIEKGLAFAAG